MYIKAPYIPKEITITKGKVKRIKSAKWEEVPESYRKKKLEVNIPFISNIFLYIIGITEFIRKGCKK